MKFYDDLTDAIITRRKQETGQDLIEDRNEFLGMIYDFVSSVLDYEDIITNMSILNRQEHTRENREKYQTLDSRRTSVHDSIITQSKMFNRIARWAGIEDFIPEEKLSDRKKIAHHAFDFVCALVKEN